MTRIVACSTLATATVIGWALVAHAQTRPTTRPAPPAAGVTTRPVAGATTTAAAATSKPTVIAVTPSPADAAKIEDAIKRLSSDAWKERQAAQDTLVTFGELAIARLQDLAAKAEDEEIRTRAGAALRQIEENASVGGSVITVKVKDANPRAVFDLIGKQARCDFPTYPRNLWQQGGVNRGFGGGLPATISMDLERVNFWTAFKEACQKSGVFPQQMGNDRRMTLQQGNSTYWNGPSIVTGPFLIVANRLDYSSSVDLATGGVGQSNFSMSLSAFVEPKVKVVQSSYNVHVMEAVDDKGNSLANNDRNFDSMSSGQQWMWNLSARLNYPQKNPGTKLARFRGAVKFQVQTKSDTLDVSDILTAKNKTVTVAGRRMLIKEVKKNGSEQFDVQMTIYRDGMSQADWNMLQYPGYSVRLLDKEGKPLNSQGWGGGGGGNEMNYNWNFSRQTWGGDQDKPGEPYRLLWEIPLETREMNVEFTFKDLTLPKPLQ
jgi:hypothetical protein